MTDRNQTYQNGRVCTHSDVQCGSANRQTSFTGRGNVKIKTALFRAHCQQVTKDPTILQLNVEGPHCKQDETFFITSLCSLRHSSSYCRSREHCTDAEKLVLPNYPTSWVFFKQEAWPCHVCPRATEIHVFGPISTDIGDRVVVCGR